MEKKKSLKANLEKTKTLFLSVGLIIAISLTVSAFSWQSESFVEVFPFDSTEIPEEIAAIVTKPKPEPPKPDKVSKPEQVKKTLIDVFIIPEDTSDFADTDINWEWTPTEIEDTIETDPGIRIFASKMPEPSGGISALRRFIANHVNYPTVAKENGIQGTVYLRFEVTKKGTIGRIEVLNPNIDNLLQEASTDVIKKLPKFKPGMHQGAKVNVWFSIPISFKLKGNL